MKDWLKKITSPMKNQIIEWLIASLVHKLKVPPLVWAIIASVVASLMYGVNYLASMGYPVPAWLTANDGIIGLVLGLLLQAHSTKYVKPDK